MKTPAMIGFRGLVMAIVGLTGSVHGETNLVHSSTQDTNKASFPQTVAIDGNIPRANPPLESTLRLSPWTTEIVKLAQSGIDESVMLAFVENAGTFGLGSDQIIYLSDIGVSAQTINAMQQHDQDLISGWRQSTAVREPAAESFFGVTLVTGRKASNGSVKEIPATPAALATLAAADDSKEKARAASSPAPAQTSATISSSVANEVPSTTSTSALAPQPASVQKKPLYPVREPYPVELLPPIIFINAPEVHPNTLIVYGFPKS